MHKHFAPKAILSCRGSAGLDDSKKFDELERVVMQHLLQHIESIVLVGECAPLASDFLHYLVYLIYNDSQFE